MEVIERECCICFTITTDICSCLDCLNLNQHISSGLLDLVYCCGVTPINCFTDEIHGTTRFLVSFNVSITMSVAKPSRLICLPMSKILTWTLLPLSYTIILSQIYQALRNLSPLITTFFLILFTIVFLLKLNLFPSPNLLPGSPRAPLNESQRSPVRAAL